ncbi:hypothetical protein BDR06DRAFT_1029586 [Suillus hirtellus]|nr:hypothetical protein BDR06DRAFT_1029586 [Suillus hirtellus]
MFKLRPALSLDIVITGIDERSRWWSLSCTHTECLLAWCKENKDTRIKLFSDSTKDAKEQGRKKKQSGTSRDTFYSQVAQAIFSNDEDPEVQRLFKEDPKAFIKPVSTCFGTYKKYNEFNKELKQSGAGKTYAELQEDPTMKSLIDTKLKKFPWWPELHGWWRTNPAFNYAFSTADTGQDFASAALEHFAISKQPQALAAGNDDTHTDEDAEDGEIVEISAHTTGDAGIIDAPDDMMVDQPPSMESFKSPFMISLNSPERSPVPNQSTTHNSPFFSDFKESSASPQSTPIDSEDSDIGASQALQSLCVSSVKGSRASSPSLSTKQSRAHAPTQSASPQSSRPPSSSHKCPGGSTLDQTSAAADRMSQMADSIMTHLNNKREDRVEHEHYKRMKLETEIWACDLKARSARDEQEHAMRLSDQDHQHQQERMTQQMEFARIEIELSHAHWEEEAQIHRIALEHGLDQN